MITDGEKFAAMGIIPGKRFELKELSGYYVVDIDKKQAIDVNIYPHVVVRGLYENLLRGCYHVRDIFED